MAIAKEVGWATMAHKPATRRGLGAALLAAVGAGLATRVVSALPRGARQLLHEANELLRPFGLDVVATGGRREVVTVNAQERADTELSFVVAERPRGILPCIRTSFINDVAEFTRFADAGGQRLPAVRTLVDGPLVSFEHFELAESRSTPTVRTTLEDTVTTFEHFDPQKSAIDPCWKAVVNEGASADSTTITVVDVDIDFSVQIAGRTWRLRDGALVETRV